MSPFFKNLGVGVGLRPAHHSKFLNERPASVSWIEVISENFMPWRGKSLGKAFQVLKKIRSDYPVALHGVSLNLGSTDSLDLSYLERLQILIEEIEPIVVSDHLSWTGVNGENMHDLLPLPYTQEALNLLVEKIDQVQNFLERRILIENPSTYLEFRLSEMSESEFIKELLLKSDCGLLLDINNVYVCSINHGFDPIAYLRHLPSDRIGQIHLAGHSKVGDFLIDTHDTPVCDEVWNLFKWSSSHFGPRSSMIERDGNIPEWDQLEIELLKMRGQSESTKTTNPTIETTQPEKETRGKEFETKLG